MEGSLMAFKVFTNGSTLQASEVNDNLMRQAVSTFSNAAARTAAITSPSEGMLTYLEDTDRFEWWSGSAWRSPFGLTSLARVAFTSATSVQADNVFTSQFDSYRILLRMAGPDGNIRTTFRSSAPADITGAYDSVVVGWGASGGATVSVIETSRNQTSGCIAFSLGSATVSLDLFNPLAALPTNLNGTTQATSATDHFAGIASCVHDTTASVAGIRFNFTGSSTGVLAIYGYRN
jgi:hypothetical protein